MKEVVTVSRLWHGPQIKASISAEGIALAMSLEDFQEALLAELGNPTTLLTRAQLRTKIETAFANIVDGIKAESAKVV